MIRQVKRNTRERTEQIMGEDDELQEAGEGVIENNRKQEERTDERVCVCVCLRRLCCKRKKKKKIYHPSSPCVTFCEAGPQ